MSKRIKALWSDAFDAGWYTGRLDFAPQSDKQTTEYKADQEKAVTESKAARDALEADMADLIDRATMLADKARQYSGCDLFDQAAALDAAVEKMLG